MKKRRIGYAAWVGMVACLYFFENNTGTRILLTGTLLCPLIPALRRAFFAADEPEKAEERPAAMTEKTFAQAETEEPGDVRPYQPGDPVNRIHWKMSAKKDTLLIRETERAPEAAEAERTVSEPEETAGKARRHPARIPAAAALLCLAGLGALPEARRGAMAIGNRIFAASEAVNAYAYVYFPVAADQSVTAAAILLLLLGGAAAALILRTRSRTAAFGMLAACTLFQTYFGLPFPAWVNVPLYGGTALWMTRRPVRREELRKAAGFLLAVSLATAILLPGTDAATEAASEAARDRLSRMTQGITGTLTETPEGETETRHTHTQSQQEGEEESRTERAYRPVTVEEEQISMPRWVNWMKVAVLLLLSAAVVSLPFTPFLLLNARKKKAQETRKAFRAANVGEAVRAIFGQVIRWLRATGHDGGNRLYREWAENLKEGLPEGYAERFAACAADYEEATYSGHALAEEKRERALALLQETETALWERADRKARLRIRTRECLRE